MNHLTDREIQTCAENDSDDPRIAAHLQGCESCRAHVTAYRQLFAELKKDDEIELPRNFSRLIIAKIEEKTESASQWREWLWIAIAGVLAVSLSIYYAGSSVTGEALTESIKELFQSRESIVSSFHDFRNWFDGGLSYILYGAFLLFVFDWLDRKLIRSKRLSGQH